MDVKERVQAYLDKNNIKTSAFEREVGLSNGYWRKTKSISANCVAMILGKYPELSAEWLLRGEGEMEKVYTHVDEGAEAIYGGSVRNTSGVSPNEFEQGLEELRRRVADLERQNTSTAEAV